MSLFDLLSAWFRPRVVPPVSQPTTATLITALNVERAKAGLGSLAESRELDEAALAWAKRMAASRTLTHGDFIARMVRVVPGHAVAENIAAGQTSVAGVVQAWTSAGHRANILGPYSQAGHGEAADDRGTLYWCVDFAS